MEIPFSFFQFEDELRSHVKAFEDQKRSLAAEDQRWFLVASKLAFAEQMRAIADRNSVVEASRISYDTSVKPSRGKNRVKTEEDLNKLLSADWKSGDGGHGVINGNAPSSLGNSFDKRFKSLPPAESLPRNETLGGYIFVCNNDTMQEDLKQQLFGLPQRYRDSVRTIQPGLPLFLYNYTTHQLHGIFEAASFGGSNIDPTAWEDKKCRGESRFPAQVRIRVRKLCKPLEEDSFRPVLHHYDGPKFRLQLSVPETLALLDLFTESGAF